MKSAPFILVLLLLSFVTVFAPAHAADPSRTLLHQANTPAARQLIKAALTQEPTAFLNEGRFEAGYLYLLSGRRVLVPGLRYHVGQRIIEVQDSLNTDSTSYWPLAALRGFDLGTNDDVAALRRYRPRLVHDSHQADRREAVQVLTATDAGPLLLGYLPVLLPGTATPGYVLLAGPGRDTTQPLRSLDSRDTDVLHLLGERAGKVQAFARTNNLHFCSPPEIARMFDYYNKLAVAVW